MLKDLSTSPDARQNCKHQAIFSQKVYSYIEEYH